MKKAFRMMLSTLLACLLLVGMMSTAMAVNMEEQPTESEPAQEQPTGPQYYPDYDEDPVQEVVEEPAAQEPVPASPKTGDNGMAVVVLMGAAACVTLVAGRKALRA